jgi:hypothetical protein
MDLLASLSAKHNYGVKMHDQEKIRQSLQAQKQRLEKTAF